MYKVNEYLDDAINNRNIVRIRSAFTTIAHEDPSFASGKFQDTLKYVESKKIEGLFDKYDKREFESRDNWDEDYWAHIVSSLVDNFCYERIEHLKNISEVLYSSKLILEDKKIDNKNNGPIKGKKEPYDKTKKMIPIVMTTGLAVTTVAAIAIGAKWVAATSGTITLAGLYTILKD